MNKDDLTPRKRPLAQIEIDLLAAEGTFSDADARLKTAERERLGALEAINKYQAELDETISELRERSIPGSRWRAHGQSDNVLSLRPEDAVSEIPPPVPTAHESPAAYSSVSAEFDRLKFYASRDPDGPGGSSA